MSKRKAELLYRTSKYGTWQPCSIVIPEDVEDVKEYCKEDLKNQGIKYLQMQVIKVEKI